MKKVMVAVIGIICVVGVMIGVAQAADKFGYVNLSLIFSEYGKTKDYDKVLGDKQTGYEAERDKMVNEVKKFQDKLNLMNEKEKEAKKGDLESKIKNLQEFDRQKQTDLRKEQDEKMKEILKDIEDTVKQYAEKEGYTMVFNDRVLVYQTKSLDITDKVIELLNKSSKK